jgi:hypothetical protein
MSQTGTEKHFGAVDVYGVGKVILEVAMKAPLFTEETITDEEQVAGMLKLGGPFSTSMENMVKVSDARGSYLGITDLDRETAIVNGVQPLKGIFFRGSNLGSFSDRPFLCPPQDLLRQCGQHTPAISELLTGLLNHDPKYGYTVQEAFDKLQGTIGPADE